MALEICMASERSSLFHRAARKIEHRVLAYPAAKSRGVGRDNKANREAWLQQTLASIPPGARLLDAGAGELQYRKYCQHLDYVSQDFAAYDGQGDGAGNQTGTWDQSRLDIVSDIVDIPEPDGSFDAIMCTEFSNICLIHWRHCANWIGYCGQTVT
ncbi:MAG: hypothetical protein HC802_17255 [Caldilineaceae bacterium]|nr:hypothetical protein [Caldilineaceae bacterium]